jgi:hypothetical protein
MLTLIKGLFSSKQQNMVINNIDYSEAINKAKYESARSPQMIAVFKAESKDTRTVSRTTLSGENIDVAINNFVDNGWAIRPIHNVSTIADQTVIAVFQSRKRIK